MAYRTEQKERLLSFLRENPERQFSMEELVEALTPSGNIGRSTVYRLMRHLTEDGAVRRFMVGGGRHIYYQYVDGKSCGCHLHLKCQVCGRLYHLDGAVSAFMQKQIEASNRFLLDERRTLLIGTCRQCLQK